MKTYEAPRFEVAGSVRELTLGGKSGGALDANFPAGTPFNSLTFS
jgi:hypothetical protein